MKLDEEREKKKETGQKIELLNELGQDSEEKGAKIAINLSKEEYAKKEQKDILTVEKLDSARSKKNDSVYYNSILAECNLRMKEFQLPIGFKWIAKVSKDGLAMYIGTPVGTYAGGVKIVGDPFIDAKGVVGLVNQALMDVELLEEQWKIQLSTKTKN